MYNDYGDHFVTNHTYYPALEAFRKNILESLDRYNENTHIIIFNRSYELYTANNKKITNFHEYLYDIENAIVANKQTDFTNSFHKLVSNTFNKKMIKQNEKINELTQLVNELSKKLVAANTQ